MSYLDRLKKSENAGGGTLQNHQNPETGGFVGFEGTPPAPFQKIDGLQAANDPTPEQPPVQVITRPAACNAKPARQQQPAPSCRTCNHARRPGGLTTLCGGRDDLPHAYTAGHPLRRLPDDGGASCAVWQASN
jgi:hypothetical protein